MNRGSPKYVRCMPPPPLQIFEQPACFANLCEHSGAWGRGSVTATCIFSLYFHLWKVIVTVIGFTLIVSTRSINVHKKA